MIRIIQRLLIYASVILLAALLGANVYTSIVDAPNWGAAIPGSFDTARQYFTVANPGTFFRIISPASQIAGLITLIATWRFGWRVRFLAAAAVMLTVSLDVFTFTYFYPRNAIMFGHDAQSADALRDAWSGWSTMNWLRSGICLLAVVCELGVLSLSEAHLAIRSNGKSV